MNGVIGMTNLLLDGTLDDEQHVRARAIKRSAESLLGIINDILDFSKIEAGKLDLEPLDFHLGALLEDFAGTFAVRTEEKGLELICPANPVTDHWYTGDPGRIRQILTNLVGNAIKFTERGEVAVRYQRVSERDGHSLLRFTVSDTGIGLRDEQQRTLFDRFTQADGSTTRRYGGTGLGLSISKQLVEMMGGEIGVDKVPGEGSTFWFTLLLANTEAQSAPRGTGHPGSQRVLVVDDNATCRQMLDEVLGAWGVAHELAASGEQALAVLRHAAVAGRPWDTVLIDMQMPGMDGARLAALIQADPQLAGTRMVLLTAQGRRGDAKKMQEAGFAASLNKPLQQSELYNTLLQVAGVVDAGAEEWRVARHTVRADSQFQARALVVEDNVINQLVAKGMLSKVGVHAESVGNGLEALDALEQFSYDLVFMDCQMPMMDGYEATKRIRDRNSAVKNHAIPIIAITANAMQGGREQCIEAGMDDYLAKPLDSAKLYRVLEKWLPNQPAQREREAVVGGDDRAAPASAPAARIADEVRSSTEPVFDHAGTLARMMGDEELVREVIEDFLVDAHVQIERFKAQVASGDVERACAQAHQLKGTAANVGGMALRALAAEMELAGKAGSMESIRRRLPELDQRFAQLKSKMEAALARKR
jgi:CheY-like chemotaxis protein/HPt (histidine-containing phosphotransfer) domain-containing protein